MCGALLLVASLVPSAHAFDPYLGIHGDVLDWVDRILLEKSGGRPALARAKDREASAEITNIGGPYDVRIIVKGTSGKDRRVVKLVLNEDGSASLVGTGRINRVGKKKFSPIHPVRAGGSLKLRTKARGTWQITDGVRTEFELNGKTNGIPTRITGFMDLTEEGGYQLSLKLAYKKGNKLFAKPSTFRFGM